MSPWEPYTCAFNKVLLRLCDAINEQSADTCANLCPDHLKSDQKKSNSADHNQRRTMVHFRGFGAPDSEFLCTKTPICWREFSNEKIRPKPPEMVSLTVETP